MHTKIFAILVLLISAFINIPLFAATLETLKHQVADSGDVELVMQFSEQVPEPKVFVTEEPSRIALDFENVSNNLEQNRVNIGVGYTKAVLALEASGRTRVVVELLKPSSYEIRAGSDNTYVLSIRNLQNTQDSAVSQRISGQSAAASITHVDFRRGTQGEGRVIIDLDDSGSSFDATVLGSEISLTIFNANIPGELMRKLDVLDFATPVSMIESFQDGRNTLFKIDTNNEFEQLIYQTDNQIVVEVSPPSEEAKQEELFLTMEEKVYVGDRVSFIFQDISIRAVLQFIADHAELNIVVSDTVQGNITLRLVNVPWDQAFDIVLDAKTLDKRENGNVIIVGPAEEIAERERIIFEALQQKEDLVPLQTAYIQVNYAKATDISALLTSGASDTGSGGSLLSDRGSVKVDERTNTLLVNDTAEKIREVRDLVVLLDRPVQQVLIESRIVIATDDFSKELGVRFGFTGVNLRDNGNILGTSGSASALDRMNNASLIERYNGNQTGFPNVLPSAPPGGIAVPPLNERFNVNLPVQNAAGQFGFAILGSNYLVDLELSALESEGRGEIISSPRLITANQKEAYIQQGVEIPYLQASSSGATNISFKEAVLELKVKPLVTPDRKILLDLAVKKDSVGELVPSGLGGNIPSIDTREIETQTLVNNGETVVIGGIYENTLLESKNQVPFLGDLPGLGAFFKQTIRNNEKAELLIFVTPRILDEGQTRPN